MKKAFSQTKFIRHLAKSHLIPLHRITLACREQKRSGGTLASHLKERGYISEDNLNRALAASMGIPYVELIPERIGRDVVASIPAEILTEHLAVPMAREGESLRVALADPSDPRALNDLALFSRREILPAVARREAILFVLDYFFSSGGGEISRAYRLPDYTPPPDLPYARLIADITGSSMVYFHLLEGRRRGMQEIHFEPSVSGLKVRYRLAAGMEERALYPPIFRAICIARLKVVAGAGEGDEGRRFSMTLGGNKVFLHLSFFPAPGGTGALVSLEGAVGGREGDLNAITAARPYLDFTGAFGREGGLYLVCGKGRGAPLRLAETAFQGLVSPRVKAIALRRDDHGDERDYSEIAVEEDSDAGYARGLQSLARQNPDAVFIDFIDGKETLGQAVRLSLAGITVVGKSDLGAAADYLAFAFDCAIPASLIASALQAILAIHPVRLLCPSCRRAEKIGDEDIRGRRFLASPGWEKLMRPVGCAACAGTGFQGTEWLCECVVFTPELKAALRTRGHQETKAVWEALAGNPVLRRGEELLREGKIDLKEFDLLRG
jgi:type IV pilus assembly protein PilB